MLNTMTAVVKGDKFTAAREAALRGIPAIHLRETNGETIIRVPATHLDLVVRWYNEPSTLVPGVGYGPGVLLLYTATRGEAA